MSVRDVHKVGKYNQGYLTFIKVICKSNHCYEPFAKLRKATSGFVIYVCPSVRRQQLVSHSRDFHEISYYNIFRKYIEIAASVGFSTQDRGFKPDRSRRIFKGEKILSTPSFGGEVKPSVPCSRFAACKRSLNGVEVVISTILPDNILAHSSTFRR